MENSIEVSQKNKKRTTIWSIISTLGNISEEKKTLIWKDTWTPIFIAALFTIAKIWKQSKCSSTEEWIKMWDYMYIYIYIYIMKYYSVIKKNEILPFATMWMDLEGIMFSEMLEKDKYCMFSLIYGI